MVKRNRSQRENCKDEYIGRNTYKYANAVNNVRESHSGPYLHVYQFREHVATGKRMQLLYRQRSR